jgi:signal transduction histidine kinase
MARARRGDLNAEAVVHRHDELGEIAAAFNRMIGDIRAREEEREELLRQVGSFNEELQAKVNEAICELRASNETLLETQQRLARSERLAVVGQIAASLAHEVGTPLNAISGHLRLLARNHPRDDDTQRRVGIIRGQLESVVKSVRTLLTRTQQPQLKFEQIDLNELVDELLGLVQPMLELHKIDANTALDHSLPLLFGDRETLLQLLLNLTNNSIDAMPGGGTIEITTRLNFDSQAAELTFSDTGAVIDPSEIDYVFEPLWTTKSAGSGFGLAIAREIAIGHCGKIQIINSKDRGASFRVTLPLAEIGSRVEEVFSNVS